LLATFVVTCPDEDGVSFPIKTVEVTGGRVVTRWFARTREMVGWDDWRCLRQVWRIRQRTETRAGGVTWEDRFYLTNLPWGRLCPGRCLEAVRLHWGIENGPNWTMDVQWQEDRRAWVRQGLGLEVLGLLRAVAYNLMPPISGVRVFLNRIFAADGVNRLHASRSRCA